MGTLKTHQKNQGENDEPFVILRFSEQIDQNKEQQKIPVIQLAQAEFVQQTGQTGLSRARFASEEERLVPPLPPLPRREESRADRGERPLGG